MRVWFFRKILHRLFLWKLSKEKPEIIKLGIDTMFMDNDDALKREGVEPTYKCRCALYSSRIIVLFRRIS